MSKSKDESQDKQTEEKYTITLKGRILAITGDLDRAEEIMDILEEIELNCRREGMEHPALLLESNKVVDIEFVDGKAE